MATSTNTPYFLPYPEQSDIADVPKYMKLLADQLVLMLNGKATQTWVTAGYQKKITVDSKPPPAGTGADGDIWFVV